MSKRQPKSIVGLATTNAAIIVGQDGEIYAWNENGTETPLSGPNTNTSGALFAELRTRITEAHVGDKLFLKGYSTPGDGGEGMFTVLSGGSYTDDGGTIACEGGLGTTAAKCAKRDIAGPFDPRWFGATNDNVDCSTAVGLAVAATPNGGELRFGEGTFNCKFSVANKPGITISGLGKKTILTHAADPAGAAWNDGIITIETNSIGARVTNLQFQGAAIVPLNSTTILSGSGPSGVTITGTPVAREYWLFKITTGGALGAGKFDWSKDNGKTWDATGVTLAATVALGATGCTANFPVGVYVLNDTYSAVSTPGGGSGATLQCGIVVQTGSDEVEIDHVLFAGTDASHGLNACVILNGVDDCRVHHNRVTHIQGHDAADGTGYGVLVDGNSNEIFENRSDFPSGHGRHHIYIGPGSYNDIHHNRCTNGWYEQIIVRATAAQATATENRIHHNRCRNAQPLAVPAWSGIGAITVGQNAIGNEIASNLVTDANMHGIMVTDYASVVVGETPDDNIVRGNQVHRSQLMGIEVEGAHGTIVDANRILDPGKAGGSYHGIQLLNTALNAAPVRCRVTNNTVGPSAAAAAYHTALVVWVGLTAAEVHGNMLTVGTTGTFLDNATGTVCGANVLNGVATVGLTGSTLDGDVQFSKALVALGGGAAPTLGTIGGSGPAAAAQNTWLALKDSTGAAFWVPAWK